MKGPLKTVFFLVLCILSGFGGARAYMWWTNYRKAGLGFTHHEEPAVLTGVGDAPGTRGFTLVRSDAASFAGVLPEWDSVFATAVGIEYQAGTTRDSLVEVAKLAHEHNMSVVLLPPSAAPATTENPYPHPLAQIAADADAAAVDFLCISWLKAPPDGEYWRGQYVEIRNIFRGKIILAADTRTLWDVPCWDAADLIGLIGPVSLPQRLPHAPADVTLHDLRVAWDCVLTQADSLSKKNRKKLALLHLNIPPTVSARLPARPSAAAALPLPRDPALQSMLYDALLLETKGRSATTEIMLFSWDATAPDDSADLPTLMSKFQQAWAPELSKAAESQPAN